MRSNRWRIVVQMEYTSDADYPIDLDDPDNKLTIEQKEQEWLKEVLDVPGSKPAIKILKVERIKKYA